MHFDIISIFPDYFEVIRSQGIIGRAYQQGLWTMKVHNPRQFSLRHDGRVDDRPFGGGAGMVMNYQPLANTLNSIQRSPQSQALYLTPSGKPLHQIDLQALFEATSLVLVCGRYEGVDQRFIDNHIDHQISVGDFVMSGGELPALCLMDALVRLIPKVLGNDHSLVNESFYEGNLLDYPHFTRPQVVQVEGSNSSSEERQTDCPVPAVLLAGDHQQIKLWRHWQSLKLTADKRPELMCSKDWQDFERLEGCFNSQPKK